MALSFNNLVDHYVKAKEAVDEYVSNSDEEDDRDEDPKYVELIIKERKIAEILLGHPKSFDTIKCWLVVVNGDGGLHIEDEDDIKEFIESLIKTEGESIERLGSMAAEVRRAMIEYDITESGAGEHNWQLGCHCTHKEAEELCKKLYAKFNTAISRGVIRVERKFWAIGITTA